MKSLLTATAAIEAGTGLLLVARPSLLATLLLGSSLDTPASLTLARVADSEPDPDVTAVPSRTQGEADVS